MSGLLSVDGPTSTLRPYEPADSICGTLTKGGMSRSMQKNAGVSEAVNSLSKECLGNVNVALDNCMPRERLM